jgi:hypothetical protein
MVAAAAWPARLEGSLLAARWGASRASLILSFLSAETCDVLSFGHANDWLSFIPWNEKKPCCHQIFQLLWSMDSTLNFVHPRYPTNKQKKLAHVIKLNCKVSANRVSG